MVIIAESKGEERVEGMRICFAGAYLLGTKDGMILREGILEGKEHSVKPY